MLAHILGLPVEELLTPAAGGVTSAVLIGLASVVFAPRRRSVRGERHTPGDRPRRRR